MEGHGGFTTTLILSAINFIIYLAILAKFLLPKMKEVSEKREKEMKIELERSKAELENAKRRYEEAVLRRSKADEEAMRIEKEMLELARAEAEKIIKGAKEYERRKEEELENMINMKVEEAKKQIRRYIIENAVKLAGELIRTKKTEEDVMRFITKTMDHIEKMRSERRN